MSSRSNTLLRSIGLALFGAALMTLSSVPARAAGPELTVAWSTKATVLSPGSAVSYSVVVANSGTTLAKDVTLALKLPAGFTLLTDVEKASKRTRTWELGDLQPGEEATAVYRLRISENTRAKSYAATLTADAANTASTTASVPMDVVADGLVSVEQFPRLSIEEAAPVPFMTHGAPVERSVRIRNDGLVAARSTVLVSTLTNGATFADGSTERRWDIGDFAAGAKKTIRMEIHAPGTGTTFRQVWTITAANADAQELERVTDVRTGSVLGASDALPRTGGDAAGAITLLLLLCGALGLTLNLGFAASARR